jgi:hypothetical protein
MRRSFSRSIFHSCIAICVGVSSASIAAPVCKDGDSVTIAGEITIDAAPIDSGRDWMLVAPTVDPSNKCTVMDLFCKGPIQEIALRTSISRLPELSGTKGMP